MCVFSGILDHDGETGGGQGHGIDVVFVQFLALSGGIGDELSHLRRVGFVGSGVVVGSEELSVDVAHKFTLLLENGLELLRGVGGALGVEIVVLPVFRNEIGPHDDLLEFGHPLDLVFAGVEFDLFSVNLDDEGNSEGSGVVKPGGEARFAVVSVAEEAGKRIFEDV